MLKSYIKITLRNLRKHSLYTLIKVAGLALGITSSLLIFLWVWDELSYDRFHENADNLYRITERQHSTTCAPLAAAVKRELSDDVDETRYRPAGPRLVRYGNTSFSNNGSVLPIHLFFACFPFNSLKATRRQRFPIRWQSF